MWRLGADKTHPVTVHDFQPSPFTCHATDRSFNPLSELRKIRWRLTQGIRRPDSPLNGAGTSHRRSIIDKRSREKVLIVFAKCRLLNRQPSFATILLSILCAIKIYIYIYIYIYNWIGLAQDRDRWRTLVSAVMHLRVPWNAGNVLTSCKSVTFWRRTLHHGVSK